MSNNSKVGVNVLVLSFLFAIPTFLMGFYARYNELGGAAISLVGYSISCSAPVAVSFGSAFLKIFMLSVLLLIIPLAWVNYVMLRDYMVCNTSTDRRWLKFISLVNVIPLFLVGYYARDGSAFATVFWYAAYLTYLFFLMFYLKYKLEIFDKPSKIHKIAAEVLGLISVYTLMAKWIYGNLGGDVWNFIFGVILMLISFYVVCVKSWKAFSEN